MAQQRQDHASYTMLPLTSTLQDTTDFGTDFEPVPHVRPRNRIVVRVGMIVGFVGLVAAVIKASQWSSYDGISAVSKGEEQKFMAKADSREMSKSADDKDKKGTKKESDKKSDDDKKADDKKKVADKKSDDKKATTQMMNPPPAACVDDPGWVDTNYGDGTSTCTTGPKGGIVANKNWCNLAFFGDYAKEARAYCPVSCGLPAQNVGVCKGVVITTPMPPPVTVTTKPAPRCDSNCDTMAQNYGWPTLCPLAGHRCATCVQCQATTPPPTAPPPPPTPATTPPPTAPPPPPTPPVLHPPPTTCVDDPAWVDSRYGDGTSHCTAGPRGGVVANKKKWCDVDVNGNYAKEAIAYCPVSCGLKETNTGVCKQVCADDPNWVDNAFGDGTSHCDRGPAGGVKANPSWCKTFGQYSVEAQRACPKSCGMCS